MNSEQLTFTETVTFDEAPYEPTLTEQIEQEERSRFMTQLGKSVAKVALVGAVAAGALTGQGHEQDEQMPEPVPVAASACLKDNKEGVNIGKLCVTKEEYKASGRCSKTDKFIGHTAVTAVSLMLPVSRAVEIITAFGTNAITDYRGDFCD